jgi:hypothetical protein
MVSLETFVISTSRWLFIADQSNHPGFSVFFDTGNTQEVALGRIPKQKM